MALSGRVAFGTMESVTFGRPFAEAVAAEVESRGAERVFLMVSGTLNRETDEIAKLRRALGNKVAGEFDRTTPGGTDGDRAAITRSPSLMPSIRR